VDLRICHAIGERALLMFGYKGTVRVAEPHLYGRNTAGHDALSAWMRPGWSRTDPEGGWRMFLVEELEAISVLPDGFAGPPPRVQPRRSALRRGLLPDPRTRCQGISFRPAPPSPTETP
jgi:hypothetical protein